jgi:hypothetical protein
LYILIILLKTSDSMNEGSQEDEKWLKLSGKG